MVNAAWAALRYRGISSGSARESRDRETRSARTLQRCRVRDVKKKTRAVYGGTGEHRIAEPTHAAAPAVGS
jgi:hypothetical protein